MCPGCVQSCPPRPHGAVPLRLKDGGPSTRCPLLLHPGVPPLHFPTLNFRNSLSISRPLRMPPYFSLSLWKARVASTRSAFTSIGSETHSRQACKRDCSCQRSPGSGMRLSKSRVSPVCIGTQPHMTQAPPPSSEPLLGPAPPGFPPPSLAVPSQHPPSSGPSLCPMQLHAPSRSGFNWRLCR